MKINYEIEKIPYTEKKALLANTCLMYKKLKSTEESFKKFEFKEEWDLNKYDAVSIFEKITKLLNEDEYIILKNDFINVKQDRNWYLDYWSKSSYYKYKHETIDKFLYLFFS